MSHQMVSFENAKVLCVEDYEFNMEIILEMLKFLGIEADAAVDGEEAVTKAEKKSYDLILMDIQMPKLDGYEATKKIRTLSIPQPKIIALTAGTELKDKEKYIQAGMDDYLGKPLVMEDLEKCLMKYLHEKVKN